MSKSALPEVSVGRSRSLAGKASPATSSDPLRASGLHPAPSFGPLVLQNKKALYDLLFRTSAETLLEVARDSKHLGAEIGFFSVLHTGSQKPDITHRGLTFELLDE